MGVATHLNIPIDEYDTRIRTFVPTYEEMVSTAAGALRLLKRESPRIVDLGVGTGELAARCLAVHPNARIVGIDSDPAMAEIARGRLAQHPSADLLVGDFLQVPIPPCDAIVASIALHHIRTPEAKKGLYDKCRAAIEPGGLFVSADCFPAREGRLAAIQRKSWLAHLEQTYPRPEAEAHLAAWAMEDVYFPLLDELEWLREAGFAPEVLWRVESFAVIVGRR